MKGKVNKTDKGWVVTYRNNDKLIALPLHVDSEKIAEDNGLVTFKIIDVYIEPEGIHCNRGGYKQMAAIVDFFQNPNNVFENITTTKDYLYKRGTTNWIVRFFCRHEFFSHRVDNQFYITCCKCGTQYKSKN